MTTATSSIDCTCTVERACGIAPETKPPPPIDLTKPVFSDAPVSQSHAVMTKVKLLWDNGSTISYSFFGGTDNQKTKVASVAPEWTYYANLTLQRQADNDMTAMVRIDFKPDGGSWSSVGKGALQVQNGGITMNLGWIENSSSISLNDRGTILHEWGHALGLMHEHQSPARGGALTLIPDAVYDYYYSTQGWDRSLIKSQILDVYSVDNVSNYSKLDKDSIMMYFMPGRLNYQNITVNVNNKLSDMDKAYMVINYPRNIPHSLASDWSLQKALDVAGVPLSEQSAILAAKADIATLRNYFISWNQEIRSKELEASKVSTAPAIPQYGINPYAGWLNPYGTQYGLSPPGPVTAQVMPAIGIEHSIWSGIVGVLKHPVFQQVVSGVIDSVLTQRGLNVATFAPAYGAQQGVYLPGVYLPSTWKFPPLNPPPFIGGLEDFQHGLGGPYTAAYGAQQGLWSGLTSVLNNPIFQQVVSGVVDAALTQHGIRPGSSVDIQQGLFSDLTSILSHPIVRNTLTGIVDAALSQRNVNPATTAQYPDLQQGVWSGLVDVLKNPAFQQVVSTVVGAALTQRGVNPIPVFAPPSGVQQGLFSDLGSILGHPLISQTVTGLINATLTQRGLSPQTAAALYPDIQQSIWSGIAGILKTPVFQQVVGTVVNTVVQGALTQRGLKPQTISAQTVTQLPDVQQSIWSGIADVLKHPVFQQVVSTVVNAALTQRGLNSTASTFPPPPDFQQGLFSGLGSILSNPLVNQTITGLLGTVLSGLNPQTTPAQYPDIQRGIFDVFQKVVGTVIDAALTQRGLNPTIPLTPANAQQGLFSDLTSILASPAVRQTITGLVNAALSQHGLNPQTTAAQYPDIQQGIFDVFQKVVGTVIDVALTQRGLNTATPASAHGLDAAFTHGLSPHPTAAQYPDIQQGIFDVFQKVIGTVVDVALLGLKPDTAPDNSQQGLSPDIVSKSILGHPSVNHALTELIDTALTQRGLSPQMKAPQYPDVQEGISDIFKNPAFQKAVSTVIDTALTRYGISPSQTPIAPTFHVQQGLQPPLNSGATYVNPTQAFAFPLYAATPLRTASQLTQNALNPYAAPSPDLLCIFPQRPEGVAAG